VEVLLDVGFQVVREQDKSNGSVVVPKGLATGNLSEKRVVQWCAEQWCACTEVVKEEWCLVR
jgi:hypothetical protein